MTPIFPRFRPRTRTSARTRAGRAAVLCALAGCSPASGSGTLDGLGAALEGEPGVAPRLSVASTFRACTEHAPDDGTIPRAHCPPSRPAPPDRLREITEKALKKGDDPPSLHTLALIDLVSGDERGIALARSIANLRRVAELSDEPAPALADLSAALIVRAERTQAPRDLAEAYETAERALQHDPRSLPALFNRALAADRFALVDETARAWRAYLTADSTSAWATEARRRLQAALAIAPLPAPPPPDAPLTAYAAYAEANPQGARELGMDRLLGEWGEAVEAADASRAEDVLSRAAALADALEDRPGGDASLADAVRAIRTAAGNRVATHALARAHREYAAGAELVRAGEWARAEPHFAAATEAAGASPALRGWARVLHGTARGQNGDLKAGTQLLRGPAQETDSARHPALAARAKWSLGTMLGRLEEWETGLKKAQESARLFARAGERENEGAVLSVVSTSRFTLGEPDSGYAALHRALVRLRSYRGSVRLHTVLVAGARHLASDGLTEPALALQDEDVAVAERRGPAHVLEARAARAHLLAETGDARRARAEVKAALPLLAAVTDSSSRRWLEADLREAEGAAFRKGDPELAARAFKAAAESFKHVPMRALRALVDGAEARLAAGDPAGATEWLGEAMRLLDERRDSIGMEPRRAAVFDAARKAVDRIVMLHLAAGRGAEALRYMDDARASLAPVGGSAPPDADSAVASPPGEVALVYSLVADTLLVWTVDGRRTEVFRAPVDTLGLARMLDALETNLERRAKEAEVRSALSALYDSLVRPVETRLGRPETPLVVIADGGLASVPFAALHDSRRGEYLVERHPLRFAVSLREARRAPAAEPAPGVLVVADPAFDRREHPLLDRLPHARTETRRIADGYAGARMLEEGDATYAALKAGLEEAGVAHFAGHAVFDDERPERSYLLLAPAPGAPGKITAAELARLDLRRVRLVVLAACRTVRSGRSRAGGFSGLSGALLAAGARGAVGSTWQVDDRFTAALMAELHRHYQRAPDGPRALRDAQLALLRSGDGALQSPAAWAGFRYAGR